jgi:hypothetical protein
LLFKKDRDGNRPVLYYKIERKKAIIQRDRIQVLSDGDSLHEGVTHRILTDIPLRNLKTGRYKIIFGFQYGLLNESENEEISIKRLRPPAYIN